MLSGILIYVMKKYMFIFIILILVSLIIGQRLQDKRTANQEPQIFFNTLQGSEYSQISTIFLKDSVVLSSKQTGEIVLEKQENIAGGDEVYVSEGVTLIRNYENEISLILENNIVVFQGGLKEVRQDEVSDVDDDSVDFSIDSIEGLDSQYLEILTATSWQWEQTQMNNDDLITPNTVDAFTLTFTDEGLVSGTTDCNTLAGSFALNDTRIQMNNLAVTRMFCENSQEAEFLNMVQTSQYIYFTEDNRFVLLLPYDSGSVIFTPLSQ